MTDILISLAPTEAVSGSEWKCKVQNSVPIPICWKHWVILAWLTLRGPHCRELPCVAEQFKDIHTASSFNIFNELCRHWRNQGEAQCMKYLSQ